MTAGSDVERRSQNIPLPLGGMTPVRVRRAMRTRAGGVRAAAAVAMLVCAGVGLVLLIIPARTAVGLEGNVLRVGAMTLARAASPPGVVLFRGTASVALTEASGEVHDAAAWDTPAGRASGACSARVAGPLLVAECAFVDATGRRSSSVDVLDTRRGAAWQRTFSDGRHVTIDVAADAAAIPVPFPTG